MKLPATSRRIVVDTNVARSASESQHPISDACRQALETLQAEQHRIVLSVTQHQEWLKHQSGFSKKWLAQMFSRKLCVRLQPEPDSGLANAIYSLDCTDRARKEMLKDVHLLENALATDDTVLSQEVNVFELFTTHANKLRISRQVAWVHPVTHVPPCVEWLQAGAEVSKATCIPAGV